ncbi:XrtB/PEP-CTERM-associated polysaccharide biosynthesis outer membrane protein EpsL [Sulfuriferula nivalis]|nr:XrtB/PEP-CTERM-associated polysaccharide biosynthesis outer membrane protein EpsL [Sulfuriferula nivalis]
MSISAMAHADLSNTFSPYVSAATAYNSNLFLLQNDQAALANLGTTNMSETYQAYAAGVNMNWQLSRQVISGHAEISQVNFNTYTGMNYTGHDLALKWDWLVDSILQGDVGVSDKLTLAPFLYTKKPLANLLTTRTAFINSFVKINNRWQIKLGADTTHTINSYTTPPNSQQYNDINIDSYNAGFRYITPKGSTFDFLSKVSNGNYPEQLTNLYTYTQYDNGVTFDWIATGKTKLSGRLNYTKRDYPNSQQNDYAGVTGRIAADWFATSKTTLNLTIYRDLNTYITSTSSYDVTQGVSAQAIWLATDKVTATLLGKHETIDFQSTPIRTDELTTASLDLGYQLFRKTKIDLIAERGVRHSNAALDSYRYNSVMLGLNNAF